VEYVDEGADQSLEGCGAVKVVGCAVEDWSKVSARCLHESACGGPVPFSCCFCLASASGSMTGTAGMGDGAVWSVQTVWEWFLAVAIDDYGPSSTCLAGRDEFDSSFSSWAHPLRYPLRERASAGRSLGLRNAVSICNATQAAQVPRG